MRTAALIRALDYVPIVLPLLRIEPITQPPPDLSKVGALAFTSVNGVHAFADISAERSLPVFAVGDATAQAAQAVGFADVTSAGGAIADLGALIADAFRGHGVILVPGAREAAGDLHPFAPDLNFQALPTYVSVETSVAPPMERLDAVLLHSPRAGRALAELWPELEQQPLIIAISANAAAPVARLSDCRIARHPTEKDLLDALVGALGNRVRAV